jgi:hypothetical protein
MIGGRFSLIHAALDRALIFVNLLPALQCTQIKVHNNNLINHATFLMAIFRGSLGCGVNSRVNSAEWNRR